MSPQPSKGPANDTPHILLTGPRQLSHTPAIVFQPKDQPRTWSFGHTLSWFPFLRAQIAQFDSSRLAGSDFCVPGQ